MAVTSKGICGYVGSNLKGCILYIKSTQPVEQRKDPRLKREAQNKKADLPQTVVDLQWRMLLVTWGALSLMFEKK